MSPLLSIIIPTRNRESYLYHLLEVLSDVRSDEVEFLIVDNSDTPLPQSSVLKDKRIRKVRSKIRLSMTSNWELGLVSAKAPWRTFIGDDDGIIPKELDQFIGRLGSSEADAIVAGFAHFYWPAHGNARGVISVWKSKKSGSRQLGLTGNLYRDFNNIVFPIPYARTVFRASLEKTVRSIQGGNFFTASSPDINSGATIAIHAQAIEYWPEIVPFVVGTSPASNGVSNSSSTTKRDFFELSNNEWLEELGSESKELNFLSYIEPIAQALRASKRPINLPEPESLIWGTLLSTPHTGEITDHLISVFPSHALRIRVLSVCAALINPTASIIGKLWWAASRALLNGDRYFRRSDKSLRTISDASKALENILRGGQSA